MSVIQLSGSIFYRPGDSTAGLTRTDPAGLVVAYDALARNLYGSFTGIATVDIREQSFGGFIQMSFVPDFYNRIHFTPQQISFGVIASDAQRQIIVWNAYLVSVDLDLIVPPAAANVAIFAGPVIPHTFAPLASATYTFVAYLAGPSSFFLDTQFSFSNGDQHFIQTDGDRSIITELGPNWAVGVTEKLEFLTEIVSISRDGHEQRRALRQEPRRSVSYNVNLWGADRLDIDGVLAKWRRRTQFVAMSPYRCKVANATAAGALVLPVVGSVPNWAGAGVTVRFSGRNVPRGVTAVIQSVTTSTITLTSATTIDLPQNALVIWTTTGRLRDGTKVTRHTDRKQTVQFSFEMTPGIDPVYTPGPASVTLQGYEVLLNKPNWRSSIDVDYSHPIEIIDFDHGIKSFFEPINYSSFTSKVNFSGRRAGEILSLTDFFYRQYGQLKEFYYPTWGPDIIPKFQLDKDGVNIRVAGFDLALDYQSQTTHRAILVQLMDGTVIPAAIESIYTVSDVLGNDSVVQVVNAWAADYPIASILKISWLMRCRLASDAMEIKWVTDEAATVQLAFQTLEHLP